MNVLCQNNMCIVRGNNIPKRQYRDLENPGNQLGNNLENLRSIKKKLKSDVIPSSPLMKSNFNCNDQKTVCRLSPVRLTTNVGLGTLAIFFLGYSGKNKTLISHMTTSFGGLFGHWAMEMDNKQMHPNFILFFFLQLKSL